MNSYAIEPRMPLVFRSGRPFGQGGDANSLQMPLPVTLAGAVRTFWAEQQGWDFGQSLDTEQIRALREKAVIGPLLAQQQGNRMVYLFPQPADALYLEAGRQTEVFGLAPQEMPENAGCDLPEGLLPVYLESGAGKGKPAKGPGYWSETHFHNWLMGRKTAFENFEELGWNGPQADRRTHVAMDAATQAGSDGLLYQTEGQDYRDHHGSRQLVFGFTEQLQNPSMIRLGGEARPSVVQEYPSLPTLPNGLSAGISERGRLRMLLLTPAIFANGWKPGWLNEQNEGTPPGTELRLKLESAVLSRWEAVSGWDLQAGKPKAIRRMVPPGAVYWFSLLEGEVAAEQLWLAHLSDHEQDRRDGFGLSVPGLWT